MTEKKYAEASALYLKLLDQTNSLRKRSSLETLWRILNKKLERGDSDFSIASIGRDLSRVQNGVSTQTIYNKTGADYRLLIEAFTNQSNHVDTNRSDRLNEILQHIDDISIRTTIACMLQEGKRAKGENQHLRSIMKNATIENGELNYYGQPILQSDQVVESYPKKKGRGGDVLHVPQRHLEAIRKGLSRERLDERGLSIEPDGSIFGYGIKLFPSGFVDAIEYILVQSTKEKENPI